MLLSDAMVQEFSFESATTKKLLERAPGDKLSWKPHEKSMSLGRLAAHIGEIPEWARTIVEDEAFDMSTVDSKPVDPVSGEEILELFQRNVQAFAEVLKGRPDGLMLENWKLKQGNQILIDVPRMAAIRSFVISHTIHHRGQLSVYLRLCEVPVPSIYGPSADEAM